jgi:transcriptional regulator with XRE-family HTH domain
VPEVRSPTLRRRELGAVLRSRRLDLGLTVEQVAERLLCSASKVSRMETGQRGATLRDVRDLCDLYGISSAGERDRLMALAREGKQQGWWQSQDFPDDYGRYVDYEQEATAIRTYQSTIVPGLLQTPEYVREMSNVAVPEVSAETANEFVEVKERRQARLAAVPPLSLSVILDEAVLHRVVGGPAVMGAQLERMIEATRIHSVTIQVIPYIAGAHPAMDSTFTILDLTDPVPSVVYVEGLVGRIYLERPQEIARYEYVFDRLKALALSPQDSAELIAKVAANYHRAAAGSDCLLTKQMSL